MIDIKNIIAEIKGLDPLPPTAIKLAALVGDGNSTVDQIVEVVRYDLALTADILKFANSAFSASQRKIVHVKDAVIRLGGARILEQVLGRRVQGKLKTMLPAYGYTEDELWRHSVAAATAAELLNASATIHISGISFTAALLHDIGKLIIGRVAPQADMESLWAMVSSAAAGCPVETAEKKVLGFSHADIGAQVAGAWQLPEAIVAAIANHHAVDGTADPVADSVKIANIVAHSIGEGLGNEGMSMAIDDTVVDRLGLTRDAFENLCARTACKYRDVMKMFDS
ncbi:MAG: HDOD domain-containing protein [Chitinivibrionales bacterium]